MKNAAFYHFGAVFDMITFDKYQSKGTTHPSTYSLDSFLFWSVFPCVSSKENFMTRIKGIYWNNVYAFPLAIAISGLFN